ncbi:universal stress protein [Geodermatophilus sp. SYSU D00758]
MTRPVVVAFDGSVAAREAAYWAAEEAVARGCPLHLVHVLHWPVRALAGLGLPEAALDAERARAAASAGIELAAERCRQHAPGLAARVEVAPGDAVEVLARLAAGAELLVLGACGQTAAPSVLLGSSAAELLRGTAGPVVVVRDTPVRRAGVAQQVVAGIDGSPASARVLRAALATAARRGWEVTAVHAWSDLPPEALTGRVDLDRAAVRERAAAALAALVADVHPEHPAVPLRQVAVVDHPAAALLDRAAGAALLAVGRHGRGAAAAPLGSVCHAVAHYAPCPVAVVG